MQLNLGNNVWEPNFDSTRSHSVKEKKFSSKKFSVNDSDEMTVMTNDPALNRLEDHLIVVRQEGEED